MRTAILVDGSFFIKRYRYLYHDSKTKTPNQVARDLYAGLLRNLRSANKSQINRKELYRIFYYDCPPLTKRVQNPVSKRGFNFGDTEEAKFRIAFHEELKRLRKVALRLGRISDDGHWAINPKKTKELLNEKSLSLNYLRKM